MDAFTAEQAGSRRLLRDGQPALGEHALDGVVVAPAMSTLVTFIERAADLLSGIDGLHWKQLLASPWMATDGTGLKVLVPKLPVAHDGYVEPYRNRDVIPWIAELLFDHAHALE